MNIYSFSLLGFTFGVLLIAVLTITKRIDSVSIRFFIFSLFICGYGFPGAFFYDQNISYATALALAKAFYAFAVFVPISWLHFVFTFIEKKEPIKHFYFCNYILAFILMVMTQTPFFIAGLRPMMDLKHYTIPGMLYHLFPLLFFMLVSYGTIHLIKQYKICSGKLKEQIKYLLLATSIAFTISGLTFLPVYQIPFPISLSLLMISYPVFMGIALIRHGLFDMEQFTEALRREKLAAMGTMAASLNHELRNPLYIAKGKLESYIDADERKLFAEPEAKIRRADEVSRVAVAQLTRAMDIMQRFSDFARPFNSNQTMESIDIDECLRDVLHLVSNEFEMQKIRLSIEAPKQLAVYANRRQVEEIFFNLIVNACQAIKAQDSEVRAQGSESQNPKDFLPDPRPLIPETSSPLRMGQITISASRVNGHVRILIADNGPGIERSRQKRVFEPFYSTKGEQGSGLGLYITKQLVEKNGGKISLKSRPGTGTAFQIELKPGFDAA